MAEFNPGTGGDLKSTSVEAAIVELGQLGQTLELQVPEEDRPSNITLTYDTEAGTANLTATMPISVNTDANGKPVITVVPYLGIQA